MESLPRYIGDRSEEAEDRRALLESLGDYMRLRGMRAPPNRLLDDPKGLKRRVFERVDRGIRPLNNVIPEIERSERIDLGMLRGMWYRVNDGHPVKLLGLLMNKLVSTFLSRRGVRALPGVYLPGEIVQAHWVYGDDDDNGDDVFDPPPYVYEGYYADHLKAFLEGPYRVFPILCDEQFGSRHSGHAFVFVLVRSGPRVTLEVYEPGDSYGDARLRLRRTRQINSIFGQSAEGFNVEFALRACPYGMGPQARIIGAESRRSGGYCSTWSAMALLYRIVNPRASSADIAYHMGRGTTKELLDRVERAARYFAELVATNGDDAMRAQGAAYVRSAHIRDSNLARASRSPLDLQVRFYDTVADAAPFDVFMTHAAAPGRVNIGRSRGSDGNVPDWQSTPIPRF